MRVSTGIAFEEVSMGLVKQKSARQTMEWAYYEVFAREEADGPLFHLGCVSAPNRAAAVGQARMVYSEKPWLEMCIVPRDQVIPVIAVNDMIGVA